MVISKVFVAGSSRYHMSQFRIIVIIRIGCNDYSMRFLPSVVKPKFCAEFSAWDLSPMNTGAIFNFPLPEGAEEIPTVAREAKSAARVEPQRRQAGFHRGALGYSWASPRSLIVDSCANRSFAANPGKREESRDYFQYPLGVFRLPEGCKYLLLK